MVTATEIKTMDFLDPEKKRSHQRRLFLGYFLIGVGIILGSVILVFLTYGFDVDRRTGQVIQNGLIFTNSSPESATIYLNGKDNGSTEKRLTVPAGSYSMELKRDGYRTWKRSFNLEGSSIERLVYPKLFPTKITTVSQQSFTAIPSFSTQSLDRKWIVVAQPGSLTKFDVFNANDPKVVTTAIALPADVITVSTEAQALTLVEWSSDNRHVLLKHTFGAAQEFIVMDREAPENSLNLNKHLAINPTTFSLRDKKFDQLYVYDAPTKVLSSVNTKTKVNTVVLNDVMAYKSHGESTLLYTTTDTKDQQKSVVKLLDDKKTYTLRRGLLNESYLLNLARFDNKWYVVVGATSEGKVYIYRDPMTQQASDSKEVPSLFTALIMTQPSQVTFSANTRFIMTQSGRKFAVYDAETNRRYYYESPLSLTAESKATWMDGHRLQVIQDGKVVVFDYDGINQQSLVPLLAGTLPYFDRDYTRLYTLAPVGGDPAKATLTRSDLKLNL